MNGMSDGAAPNPSTQNPSTIRTYGGVAGEQRTAERRERLMASGLELLGSADDAGLTVRGVCKESGLIARYFYESFDDIDALAVALHDQVITDLVAHALGRLGTAGADPDAQLRTGLEAIIEHLADDPRRGRVLFVAPLTMPVLVARRPETVTMFAGLLRAQATEFVDLSDSSFETTARFLVGGFGEVLTSWQDGTLDVTQDELVERCYVMFRGIVDAVAPPL